VGLLGGLALFYIYNIFHRLLRLDSVAQPPKERTARQYREEKARHKARPGPHLLSPQSNGNGNGMVVNLPNGLGSASARGGNRNLLDQTIMEEMDSDY
jgi:hypothetical protein